MHEPMNRNILLDIGEVLRSFQAEGGFEELRPDGDARRTIRALSLCRTAEMGGHVDTCSECGEMKISYNSCRNRHCPKCQHLKRERWILDREKDLLPIKYHHMVFTVPAELNLLFQYNKRRLYSELFRAVSATITGVAEKEKYLGAKPGIISILHTWGQTLTDHPHIHCIVTGGGLAEERWIEKEGDFFLPVRVLSRLFRGKLLHAINKLQKEGLLHNADFVKIGKSKLSFSEYLRKLYKKEWVVFCKEPFRKPEHLIQYLGRYTHRIAISNHRILDMDEHAIVFSYKDYAQNGKIRSMKLSKREFVRRFLLHVLPEGFVKIRYYGILANPIRRKRISLIRKAIQERLKSITRNIPEFGSWKELFTYVTGKDPDCCPSCLIGRFVTIGVIQGVARPP
jgi:hypothetical protein